MATKTSIQRVGEFGLIDLIGKVLSSGSNDSNLILGIGDDAAVFKTPKKVWNVATVDALTEGVHFDLRNTDYKTLGWKALASNLSDIAAMGAVPKWALVNLTIPAKIRIENITELYRGIAACARKFKTRVIGGNITKATKEFVIGISLMGEVDPQHVLKRSSAKPGDVIAVTGDLGGSHAGLRILKHSKRSKVFSYVVRKHLMPVPRNQWALRLLNSGVKINSCIDISDGLSSDLSHVCRASKVGAELNLEKIPVHPETYKVAELLNENVLNYILHGGEEYELLMTLSPQNYKKAKAILGKHITGFGIVNASRSIIASRHDGKKIIIGAKGFKHF